MSADTPTPRGFRRQVVFRLDLEHWPLLEQAVAAHGSIQAAVLAGLRALEGPPAEPERTDESRPSRVRAKATRKRDPKPAPPGADDLVEAAAAEEIKAREAARLLGLKSGTVRGYIRSGRLPGRYDGGPTWRGWLTTRGAIEAYRARRG